MTSSTSITPPVAGYQHWLPWLESPRTTYCVTQIDMAASGTSVLTRSQSGTLVIETWARVPPGGSCVFEMFLTTSHVFYARVNQSSEPQRNVCFQSQVINAHRSENDVFFESCLENRKKGTSLLWVVFIRHSNIKSLLHYWVSGVISTRLHHLWALLAIRQPVTQATLKHERKELRADLFFYLSFFFFFKKVGFFGGGG